MIFPNRFQRQFLVIVSLIAFSSCSTSKKAVKTDTETLGNLQKHVQYLADDRLEGRRTGTAGEQLAVDYIASRFSEYGISPKGTEYYTQSFVVNDGKQIDTTTSLIINGTPVVAGKGFFPFPYSADITIEALPSISVHEAGMPWFFDLEETLEENKSNPHFDLPAYIRANAKKAMEKGASAVILYNSTATDDKLVFDGKDRSEKIGIPVIYISKPEAAKWFADKSATINMKLTVSISDRTRVGHNVIGYIDNKAANTVVLGAHFDHLGYGEDGNSMIRNAANPAIHNGADDNASGTAALIELARLLKNSKAKNNNYLFIAFSGEELGLYGSKYFVENPTIDLKSVNYMINMDMVGRLNDSTKQITIGGYGTSPQWPLFRSAASYSSNESRPKVISDLEVRIDSSGTGPSDHTSFYRKDIPVLFYFTGLHSDYHKPSDDADKVNYSGEVVIIDHIRSLIEAMDNSGKLTFSKTREAQTTTTARFSVSLGIMPDYTYSGTGVKADGISEGKPAQKAGIQAGDVVISIGPHSTNSLEQYMQALSKFKKGDKAVVKFKRGDETREATVEF